MNKTYDPKSFEDRIYANWIDKKYFHACPDKARKPFTIVIPPPNITGQLHIGHALDDTLQDAIIRYKRMKGFNALWIPGTDHASIATEVKIVDKMREEGLTKEQIGREGFLKRAYAWNDKYGGRIVEQLKKMGFSCDWDRLTFTMDEKCSKAVREVFVNLYQKGLVYRGSRIINWCPKCKTALSDAEVEYEEQDSHLWHLKYLVEGTEEFIVVATTRPETMLGDTAVAVHPDDKRYKKLIGKNVLLPLTDRKIPVVADKYVDKAFGTGAVKITPAHDPNDFEVGLRHNLPVIRVMNDDGTMAENAGKYAALDRYAARKAIVQDLQASGLLEKIELHKHNVGNCYRCRTTIEPIVSKQWFVKMAPLAEPAVNAVKKTKEISFIPKRFEKIYLHWMENIRDWCISRQLWWGHRIPAYYCEACGHMEVSKIDLSVCPKCGGAVNQDEDVLDTWFSSALWPFSTLGYPDKTPDYNYFYPTNVLVTAYDIIFFWVARMIFSGLEHTGKAPFSQVLIHGIVRDEQGRKMSKSLGNGIDPLEIVEAYGADSLRFSLLNGIAAGGDIKYSRDKLDSYRNFMNKIWNAARFVLMNAENTKVKDIADVKLTIADKWILSRLNATVTLVTQNMDKFEVGLAGAALYDFIWNEFCDWYIELSKTALYNTDENKRSDTVSVLLFVLRSIVKLAHPIIPFITAEIYDNLPNKDAADIMVSAFPEPNKAFAYKKPSDDLQKIMEIIRKIRATRQEMNVGQNKRTAIYAVAAKGYEKLIQACSDYLIKLGQGNKIDFVKPDVKCIQISTPYAEVFLPMGELVDADAELLRLTKELDNITDELIRAENKLGNVGFTAKAPAALIETEKQKVDTYKALKQKVEESIRETKELL